MDFGDEATYHRLRQDGRAFIEFVIAFIVSIGFQLKHKCNCPGGFRLTRHSHYMRVRLNGLVIWRIQCTQCKAVFTVLPYFVMRYRKMKPETARKVLLATHGGLSLEYCAMLWNVSPMAICRCLSTSMLMKSIATAYPQKCIYLPSEHTVHYALSLPTLRIQP